MLPAWPSELDPALAEHLAAQRWYAGGKLIAADGASALEIRVEVARRLWSDGETRELWQLLVTAGGGSYQLILGVRPSGEAAEFLNGHDSAVLGATEGVYVYDALVDPEMAKIVLDVASSGSEQAARVRPVTAEQSNTSLVFDDRMILKVFRRVWPAPNPDVEMTSDLFDAGFRHVAAPILGWRDLGYDLAFGQQYLAGGSEGWALALTSLRDLYGSPEGVDAGEAGGDFAGEAERLGRMTAEMHVTLRQVYGLASGAEARAVWAELVAGLGPRLRRAEEVAGFDIGAPAARLLDRLREVADPGPMTRVHGDFHLGQVMRTDAGWHVLDFEGEPDRPIAERVRPGSPLKDVAGMLRSLHYASRHAVIERPAPEQADGAQVAASWEAHNRKAFVDGYRQGDGAADVLPANESTLADVLAGYELDKVLYELDYELAHRPDWVAIPLDALSRLVGGADRG